MPLRNAVASLLLAAFVAFAALAVPAGASDLELPPAPHFDLSRDALFARIDSLEAIGADAPPLRRAADAEALGRLYLATDLLKHRQHAISMLAEAYRLDPTRTDALYLQAATLLRMGYDERACSLLEEQVASDPENLEDLLMLAKLNFVRARSMSHENLWSRPYQLFTLAMSRDPSSAEALYGTGVTALLVKNFELARGCAERLAQQDPEDASAHYLAGAAQYRSNNAGAAWAQFLSAFRLSSEELRRAFLGEGSLVAPSALIAVARSTWDEATVRKRWGDQLGEGPIDWPALVEIPRVRTELLERWWMLQDPSPDQFANEGQLEYWTRMVEADLMFADPESGLRGWQSLPGEVWVRMGPALHQNFWIAEPGEDVMQERAPGNPEGGGKLTLPNFMNRWDWSYVVDGVPKTVRFSDETFGRPRWAVGPRSDVDMGRLRAASTFVQGASVRPRDLALSARICRFPMGEDSILETAIAVRDVAPADTSLAAAPADSILMEWWLQDDSGRRVEERARFLTDETTLSALMAASGQPPVPLVSDPRITMFRSHVRPGQYEVHIKATDTRDGRFSSQAYRVRVPPALPTGDAPRFSSIQLAHGFPRWERGGSVPPEFVKHDRVVLAAARSVIEGPSMGVYFEISHLQRGPDGRTDFNTDYRIYEATGRIRVLAAEGRIDPDQLRAVDVASSHFLNEHTGKSPAGFVVKGTAIDISKIPWGDYVLAITVRDNVTGQKSSTAVAFRRTDGEDRLRL